MAPPCQDDVAGGQIRCWSAAGDVNLYSHEVAKFGVQIKSEEFFFVPALGEICVCFPSVDLLWHHPGSIYVIISVFPPPQSSVHSLSLLNPFSPLCRLCLIITFCQPLHLWDFLSFATLFYIHSHSPLALVFSLAVHEQYAAYFLHFSPGT